VENVSRPLCPFGRVLTVSNAGRTVDELPDES